MFRLKPKQHLRYRTHQYTKRGNKINTTDRIIDALARGSFADVKKYTQPMMDSFEGRQTVIELLRYHVNADRQLYSLYTITGLIEHKDTLKVLLESSVADCVSTSLMMRIMLENELDAELFHVLINHYVSVKNVWALDVVLNCMYTRRITPLKKSMVSVGIVFMFYGAGHQWEKLLGRYKALNTHNMRIAEEIQVEVDEHLRDYMDNTVYNYSDN